MLDPNTPLLSTENISKLYSRSTNQTRINLRKTLLTAMTGKQSPKPRDLSETEFWALQNISFSVKRGEMLGIIGLNGSGKTTLLRLLGGQILPDAGEIIRRGETSSMIDLTAGFQTSSSGHENIFLRGAALGRDKAQMQYLYRQIVEFADIGDAIHAPVATYSSGMTMRLAFSILITVTPDILLIDEILAVGDFKFRQKCLSKIREIRDQVAFVFVSHNMTDISRFCDRVIVLSHGKIIFTGKPRNAIEKYESLQTERLTPTPSNATSTLGPQYYNSDSISNLDFYWADENGERINSIKSGTDLFFYIEFIPRIEIKNLVIGIPVWTENGTYVTGFSTEITGEKFLLPLDEKTSIRLHIPKLSFNPDYYISNLTILDGPEYLIRKAAPRLKVEKSSTVTWGVVTLNHTWTRIHQINAS